MKGHGGAEPGLEQTPDTFHDVDMDLVDAVSVGIPGILPFTVVDRDMDVAPSRETGIDAVLIGVDGAVLLDHLGVETQRQWTDLAIARTTPALLGLFSLVTLMAHERWQGHDVWVRRAAWYDKTLPTFVDALAEVRRAL